jgi:glycosyltransferase involved in cell wall biosynthesis
MMIDLEVIVATYNQNHSLRCLIESFLSQTNQSWKLHIIHDGLPNKDFMNISGEYERDLIRFYTIPTRFNDWGHSVRDVGVQYLGNSKYTLFTNGDNYYIPHFVDEMTRGDEDLVYCDMIHSHDWKAKDRVAYRGAFITKLEATYIDCGCCIVRTDIAKRIGWRHRNRSADWGFIKDVLDLNPTTHKVDKVLFVHN